MTRSPAYAELRAVIRPAIVAHGVLRLQHEQTTPLVAEAKSLIALTEELLMAVGLAEAHATPTHHTSSTEELTRSAPDQLAATYSRAGMAWAEVLASAIALATGLITAGQPMDAEQIADCLHALGETVLAADLRTRIDDHRQAALAREAQAAQEAAQRKLDEEAEASRNAAAIQAKKDTEELAIAQELRKAQNEQDVRQFLRVSDSHLHSAEKCIEDCADVRSTLEREPIWSDARKEASRKRDEIGKTVHGYLDAAIDVMRSANELDCDLRGVSTRMERLVRAVGDYTTLYGVRDHYASTLLDLETRAGHVEDLSAPQIKTMLAELSRIVGE